MSTTEWFVIVCPGQLEVSRTFSDKAAIKLSTGYEMTFSQWFLTSGKTKPNQLNLNPEDYRS